MSAIHSLLQADVRIRIGANGFDTFTNHPFFADIDFEALERMEYEPVFKPSREKTNFDATYDLEELLLEEAPLEARARRQRPRERLKEDATAQEKREDELHKMIETHFEPFDYTTVQYDKYESLRDAIDNLADIRVGVLIRESHVKSRGPLMKLALGQLREAKGEQIYKVKAAASHRPLLPHYLGRLPFQQWKVKQVTKLSRLGNPHFVQFNQRYPSLKLLDVLRGHLVAHSVREPVLPRLEVGGCK